MKIERIDHLNLTVADIGRSIEFYDRVLGMKTESIGEGRAALLFGQGLNNFQGVETIMLGDVISDGGDFTEMGAARYIRGRATPCRRQ